MGTRFVAQSMCSFHPVDAEIAPPHPRGPVEARRLGDLAWVENLKQGRVDDQGLRFAYQFGQDSAPQGFQAAPELAYATVQRGGVEADDPREEVREEAGFTSRKKERSLSTPRSCWKRASVMTSESESSLRFS